MIAKDQFAHFLYHLSDREGRVYYAGITTDPRRRVRQHIRSADRLHTPLAMLLRRRLRDRQESLEFVVVATVCANADPRIVEREDIDRLYREGHPIHNIQGVMRQWGQSKDSAECQIQIGRWAVHRADLIRRADAMAELIGMTPLHSELRGLDILDSFRYLIQKLDWTSFSMTERMYRRMRAFRIRNWRDAELVDKFDIPYPATVFLGDEDSGKLSSRDYLRAAKFEKLMDRCHLIEEISKVERLSGSKLFEGYSDMEGLPKFLTEEFHLMLADYKKLQDCRFRLFERLRIAIQRNAFTKLEYLLSRGLTLAR